MALELALVLAGAAKAIEAAQALQLVNVAKVTEALQRVNVMEPNIGWFRRGMLTRHRREDSCRANLRPFTMHSECANSCRRSEEASVQGGVRARRRARKETCVQ